MADLGRFRIGDHVPLQCVSLNGSRVPVKPDQAPTATIYNASGVIEGVRLPVKDRYNTAVAATFFQKRHRLSSSYSTGFHYVSYTWEHSGAQKGGVDTFEVIAGGDSDGAVISAGKLERPDGAHFIYQTDSGALRAGRNPT